MSGTATGIWIMCAVIVAGLVIWLVAVALAARHPGQEHPRHESLRGLVQGGQHVGGGRSVAPTRDAPVAEGGGELPTIEEQVAAHEGQETRDSGNPMDL